MRKQGCKKRILISIFSGFLVISLVAGCAAPPTQLIAEAQAALEKAKAAGADVYAKAQYQKAQDALDKAMTFAEKRKYKEAEIAAREAIALAELAEKAAIEGKKDAKARAAAKREADFELAAAGAAITSAKGMIANAKKGKAAANDIAKAESLLEAAERMASNAKSMIESESYVSAIHLAGKAREKAEAAGSEAFAALQAAKAGAKAKADAAKKAAKAKSAAKREADFELAAAEAAITSAKGMIAGAKKEKAAAKDIAEAEMLLETAERMASNARSMIESESYKSSIHLSGKAREKAEAAGSVAFAALQKAKKPPVSKVSKKDAAFEVSAAGAAITSAEAMVAKASQTERAGQSELNAARTQLSQAKSVYERAKRALRAGNYATARDRGIMARELAEKAGSSAFKAIAMAKKPAK